MKLLRHFGSMERVREASEQELAQVTGTAAARKIRKSVTTIADTTSVSPLLRT
jgi:ERCC4-type nuclease